LLVNNVRQALGNTKKKDAVDAISTVISCIEKTLMDNLDTNQFSIKLRKFGKFTVRHRPASIRRIPLTGETKLTSGRRKIKFVVLGALRKAEKLSVPGQGSDPAKGKNNTL
jgi:nucleoid DNA-binding protein